MDIAFRLGLAIVRWLISLQSLSTLGYPEPIRVVENQRWEIIVQKVKAPPVANHLGLPIAIILWPVTKTDL